MSTSKNQSVSFSRGRGRGRGHSSGRREGNDNKFNDPFSPRNERSYVRPLKVDAQASVFIKSLLGMDIKKLVSTVVQFKKQWHKCWDSSSVENITTLENLATITAMIPFSADLDPPPISACKCLVRRISEGAHKSDQEKVVKTAETLFNFIKRLVKFEWSIGKDLILEGIHNMLENVSGILSVRYSEHRNLNKKIAELFEELDKPWSIKIKGRTKDEIARVATEKVEDRTIVTLAREWKEATISWITTPDYFVPPCLPVMRVPDGVGGGVYDSLDQYFDTVYRIWIALTFEEGHNALSPTCKCRDGEKLCGHVLWPIPPGSKLRCNIRKCGLEAEYACANGRHDFALCSKCYVTVRKVLTGCPSKGASTHIYDGRVSFFNCDGLIAISQLQSRNPPAINIHWKTTRRLAQANLVGVVRLAERGSLLTETDRIYWAEIVASKGIDSYDEFKQRESGRMTIQLFDQDSVDLVDGESVAIIDCQTFVPEFVPVLKALENQLERGIPFNDGSLLNIGSIKKAEECPVNIYDDDQELSISAVYQMIDNSTLDPIIEIRRDDNSRERLCTDLFYLLRSVTLDSGQLKSFISAMINPVHCTLGPPGTGKSYLGVVITRALLLVRKHWIAVSPSVGCPPILVLSYKNHAIDEFLVDLVNSCPRISMIRLGTPKEPNLSRYAEREAIASNYKVSEARKKLQEIFNYRKSVAEINDDHSKVLLGRVKTDEEIDPKTKKKLEYESAVAFSVILERLKGWLSVISCHDSDHVMNLEEQLVSMEIIEDVMNLKFKLESNMIPALYEDLKEMKPDIDVTEMLWMWLNGLVPPPQCESINANNSRCKNEKLNNSSYCEYHTCFFHMDYDGFCANEGIFRKGLCEAHSCSVENCNYEKLADPQLYCLEHSCYVCLNNDQVANLVESRHTCESHPLCMNDEPCENLAVENDFFCADHLSLKCNGLTNKNRPCRSRKIISRDVPYCDSHKNQYQPKIRESFHMLNDKYSVKICSGKNKKKKPCKSMVLPNSIFCKDHQSHTAMAKQVPLANFEAFETLENEDQEEGTAGNEIALQDDDTKVEENDISDVNQYAIDMVADAEIAEKELLEPDEMEEADHLTHLREVFELEKQVEDEWLKEEEAVEFYNTETGNLSHEQAKWIDWSNMTWSLNLEERWNLCLEILKFDSFLINWLSRKLIEESTIARIEYKDATIKANSSLYEGKEVIGGTIVGCIKRLESIRANNPFAIIVEEASEVLEPLLFSCLGPSTCKFEMIGDHLQLQPSLQSKFDFERVNKVNVSMFERLVRAPPQFSAEFNVLSLQRRMRKQICDLTRFFYKDVTTIEDHEYCETKKIKGLTHRIEMEGLLVPGLSHQLFFWSHGGSQGKAFVGMSKINQTECNMVCHLARYLVHCGVPKRSIAILTPYKGQLMIIRKQLMKENLLASRDHPDSCIVSTVDRFQGDEADVVLVSLVTDAKSKTAFVKLQNRMIVLLSRARIGLYVVGNLGYFDNKSVDHWSQTLERFKKTEFNDSFPNISGVEKYLMSGPRVSSSLILCCPVHRDQTKTVTNSENLALGFCQVICQDILYCTHPCGEQCHFPRKSHVKECQVLVDSTCYRHPKKLKCHQIAKGLSIDVALANYKCQEKVDVTLPCSHSIQMRCFEEVEIIKGSRSWPKCTERSVESWIHDDCKHELQCSCYEYDLFKHHPEMVPMCTTTVVFVPNCNHQISIECYRRNLTTTNIFKCPKKMTLNLPRCGHEKTVSCSEFLKLQEYSGSRNETPNSVYQDRSYGPKDSVCLEEVAFIKNCGHTTVTTCESAYELAINPPFCDAVETIVSPVCGHQEEMACSMIKKAKTFALLSEPIDTVEQGKDFKFNNCPGIISKCNKQITFHRSCGHVTGMPCRQLQQGIFGDCLENIKSVNPICGHALTIPCGMQSLWKPWSDDYMNTINYKMLMDAGILLEDTVKPLAAPSALSKVVSQCKCKIAFKLNNTCGHVTTMSCEKAFKLLGESLKPKCMVVESFELNCKHVVESVCWEYQAYKKGSYNIVCDQNEELPCWNYSSCGNIVILKCSSTDIPTCESETEWICPSNRHTFKLKQCSKGVPSHCINCSRDSLELEIKKIGDALDSGEDLTDFVQEMLKTYDTPLKNFTALKINEEVYEKFLSSLLILLQGFQKKSSNTDIFNLQPVLCFSKDGKLQRSSQYEAIRVTIWNHKNASLHKNEKVFLGLAFCCKTLIDPSIVKTKKGFAEWIKQHKPKFDSVYFSQTDDLYLWGSFCFIFTHQTTINHTMMMSIKDVSISPLPVIKFSKPQARPFEEPVESKVLLDVFNGTIAEGISIIRNWEETSFGLNSHQLGASVEKELNNSLLFANLNNEKRYKKIRENLFGGVKVIAKLQKNMKNNPMFSLFKCLEFIETDVKSYGNDALKELQGYLKFVKYGAHPLLLLAIGRLTTNCSCLQAFVEMFPAAHQWVKKDELNGSSNKSVFESIKKSPGPVELWSELKEKENCHSAAMETLLKMTGMKKVKESAIQLFKSALAFKKMSPEKRNKNQITFNRTFVGNPGTGKTVTARLFAEILYDSGIRSSKNFVESSAQKLKDNGSDSFRQLIQTAMGGVLFIDEAYDLDPAGDFKGKPIASELLVASENHRDNLTIILAGYKDDIESKLMAYNDGFKSRFTEVLFEDFDQEDLEVIWNGIVKEKEWTCSDKIARLASRKLAKGANRKGFGNARSVRNFFEACAARAYAREDWNGDLVFKLEDVVGSNPLDNPKLASLVNELESKIGWKAVKKTMNQLIEIASKNYARELEGLDSLNVFMNRMFLGNPGTGKTTCASLYGKILKQLNFLSNGEVVSKTASDFMGSAVGESAKKTNEILKLAAGKVLLIDEAYNLDDSMYGKQVLDVLVERIQGPSDDIAVLLLGYERPMLDMIRNQNDGLARRFPMEYAFYFEDYTDNELLLIFNEKIKKQKLDVSSYAVSERAMKILLRQKACPNFGNAGSVELLIQSAVAKATVRQTGSGIVLEPDDFEVVDSIATDPFAPLDKLVNVDDIRKGLQTLQNSFKVALEEGREVPELGHFVFRGKPGTGKTTVARVMADILYQLELIATQNIIETSGLGLTGEFVGQTKEKVNEKLGQAKGGILFIDEAYELGKGPFGEEAMTTLLAAMTSNEYKGLVIIIAGYPADIDRMLNRNEGLKSRFTTFFEFLDWDVNHCVGFLEKRATDENFKLEEGLKQFMSSQFKSLMKLPGWGNGRDVDKVFKGLLKHRSNRVVNQPEIEKQFLKIDLQLAFDELLNARKVIDIGENNEIRDYFQMAPPRTRDKKRDEPAVRFEKKEESETVNFDTQEIKDERDPGVSEEIWKELEKSKQEYFENLERLKREKKEEELRELLRKKQQLQERLRRICHCPMGYQWYECGGGWRCGGGSHYVSNAQLENQFTYSE